MKKSVLPWMQKSLLMMEITRERNLSLTSLGNLKRDVRVMFAKLFFCRRIRFEDEEALEAARNERILRKPTLREFGPHAVKDPSSSEEACHACPLNSIVMVA